MKKTTIITILFCIIADTLFLLSSYQFLKSKVLQPPLKLSDANESTVGRDAYKDQFPVFIGEIEEGEPLPEEDLILGEAIDLELPYKKVLIEMPLFSQDYYYGKHINAAAGINELNYMPVLKPGDRIRIITDGYLTMGRGRGYVSPGSSFMFASGVCWSASALGMLMDEANKTFNHKYNIPLFVFAPGDRLPHPHWYLTYQYSNHGLGYTVVRIPTGGGTDYRFTLNPKLKELPQFEDLKIKIVMISSNDHSNAYLGQSIGGYIKSNVDF